MNGRDLHTALKSDVVAKVNAGRAEIVLARLQWSKSDVGYSLHVNPTTYSTSGLQTTDFLAYLGFARSDQCPFTEFKRCYCKRVDERFNVGDFATAFNAGYVHLEQAQVALEACGFILPQPEGWGFFNSKPSGRAFKGPSSLLGDGHNATKTDRMKQTEDDTFFFRFTFIESDSEKGFVTHYRPKHPPLSSELRSVFKYLGLHAFQDCPEFDFEECHFRTLRFESRGNSIFDSNTEFAHRMFGAHVGSFSRGIKSLLSANAVAEDVGMPFLPIARPSERVKVDIGQSIVLPLKPAANTASAVTFAVGANENLPDKFDVAFSFAGTERSLAHALAEKVRAAGYAVFYDDFYPETLWGKNLANFFDEIFRKKSRFCVMFISKEYQARKWTSYEARSAQARALDEKGGEYILPIKVDKTELEGLLPTLGYVSIEVGIDKISDLLIKKLRS